MYLERRIQAAIHGEPEFDFSAIIGWGDLGMLNPARPSLITNHVRRCRECREALWRGSRVHKAHH